MGAAAAPAEDDEGPAAVLSDEALEVRRRRYQEARRAGLTIVEAELFADGDTDIGVLRRLVGDGCAPPLIAAIVI